MVMSGFSLTVVKHIMVPRWWRLTIKVRSFDWLLHGRSMRALRFAIDKAITTLIFLVIQLNTVTLMESEPQGHGQYILSYRVGWNFLLYFKPLRASMPFFITTNSAPKSDVSSIDCLLENHCTRAVFTYIKKPLLDLQDTLSPAWLLSINIKILTSFPQGSGMFMGIVSSAFQ